jgi:hypothetical protein
MPNGFDLASLLIEGGSVNRCFKSRTPGTEKGYLENWAAEKPRLFSYTFPRAVEIGRRLLFRISLFEKLFRPGNTYCVFYNAVTMSSAKKNDSRSRSADFGMGGAVIFAP